MSTWAEAEEDGAVVEEDGAVDEREQRRRRSARWRIRG